MLGTGRSDLNEATNLFIFWEIEPAMFVREYHSQVQINVITVYVGFNKQCTSLVETSYKFKGYS